MLPTLHIGTRLRNRHGYDGGKAFPMRVANLETAWLEKLQADKILLIDGGTGSELQRRGVSMNANAWSGIAAYTHKALLREIHEDYIRAGAEVVTTNTFGTTRFVLESAGLGGEFKKLNRLAIEAATEGRDAAAQHPVAIAGSLSCLPPKLDVAAYPNRAKERDGYRELADFLAEGGVDLIALEMMEDTRHATMAMEAALEVELPVWLGVSTRLSSTDRTLVGFDFPDTPLSVPLKTLIPMGPTVVNIMHTPPEAVEPALNELKSYWTGPVGAYPELGDFSAPNWQFTDRLSLDEFVLHAAGWVQIGARLLGGCCGTTPNHIRALRDAGNDLWTIAQAEAH